MNCTLFAAGILFTAVWTSAAPGEIAFSQSATSVEAYDFVEVVIAVASPDARNPFTDVAVRGSFGKAGSPERYHAVDGFCDTADGSTLCIRFMPPSPGRLYLRRDLRSGRRAEGLLRDLPRHRRPSPRAHSRRSPVPLALYLGGHRRALLLQRHHCLLADGLEGRAHRSLQPRAPASAQG